MTELIYQKDSYQKEFEATVVRVEGKSVVLDKTIFYPQSGGQPSDTGSLVFENKEFKVVVAKKIGTDVSHELETEEHGLKEGCKISGKIDWNTRHIHMRYHTACHVLSYVVHKETGALITGNQIGADKSRIDFDLENFDREKINEFEQKANEIIKKDADVKCEEMLREEAFKIPSVLKLKNVLPPSVEMIRIVDIGGLDKQACGGTHVKNTREIGEIKIIKTENKGKNNRRIVFGLVNV